MLPQSMGYKLKNSNIKATENSNIIYNKFCNGKILKCYAFL